MVSCNDNDNIYEETTASIRSIINFYDLKINSHSVFMIIPNSGCDGCITTAEQFVKQHSTQYEDVLFVFTNINSMKKLQNSLGASVINKPNVITDTNNLFKYPISKNEIYPLIIYISDGEIIKIDEQSPSQNGISNLLSYLNHE